MKSLLSKSLQNLLVYTAILLLCNLPIFFQIMKYYYTEDLDDLIRYKTANFIDTRLPGFSSADVGHWNKFNEDLTIIPFDDSYPLDEVLQKSFYAASEEGSVDYRVLYTAVRIEGQSYILMSRVAMIENHDLMYTLALHYGLFFLILLLSIFGLQQILSYKLWRPFYSSLDAIEKFSLEKGLVPRFDKTDTTEFIRLNANLTKLIENNLAAYNQQKEFTENASHELQTPLAVFQSQLDLLLQDDTLTESQMQVIQSLYDVSSRLSRLNKNLLLLARMDNAQFKETESIDFIPFLEKQLSYLEELAHNNGLNLSVEYSPDPLLITANKVLLESLVNNLIVNAVRHNVTGGSISIRLDPRGFSVCNTGEAKALDKNKIFRRFNHVSGGKRGNGLGLSIVNRICVLHAWRIDYTYSEGKHLFAVAFLV